VVDDEEAIRKSASLLLKVSGFEAHQFDCGEALLACADELTPGCVLLDIRMQGVDGFEVLDELKRRRSRHTTVVMTGHGDVRSAVTALRNGAVAFIEKPFSKASLLEVVELAFARLEDPQAFSKRMRDAAGLLDCLSETERKVFEGLTSDRSNEEISTDLGLEIGNIELLRARLMDQLNVQSISAALNIAYLADQHRER
jgi:two-component system response regulator FixJ